MVIRPTSEHEPGHVPAVPTCIGNGRFTVMEQLGTGSFGVVHSGVDQETGEEVAVKFEELICGFLEREMAVMRRLQQPNQLEHPQGFARLFYAGKEGQHYRCIVMERLGRSLLDHFRAGGGRLSEKTTVLVAEQVIPCIEYLHSKGIVHRDIKPENLMTGLGARAHHVTLIDFGMAAEYHDGRRHAAPLPAAGFHGNFRYASIGAHRCCAQSRRDDLEALGYVLVFLLRGSLPWSGIVVADWRVKNQSILAIKESLSVLELVDGLPPAFGDYLAYCRELGFKDRPAYAYLLDLFQEERQRLAEEEGAPIKEHDVEWIDKSAATSVAPILPRTDVRQPDDRRFRRAAVAEAIAAVGSPLRRQRQLQTQGLQPLPAGEEPGVPRTLVPASWSSVMTQRLQRSCGSNASADSEEQGPQGRRNPEEPELTLLRAIVGNLTATTKAGMAKLVCGRAASAREAERVANADESGLQAVAAW